jgi:hypothetical protein
MGRVIVGVIVGFIVTGLIVSAGFVAGLFGLGLDWILEPGTYDATTKWSVIALVIGLVGAIIGGLVCSLIARKSIATKVLAALLLVFGGLNAGLPLMSERPELGPRPADETMDVSIPKLQEPTWVAIANPIVGFVGVMIGGSLRRPRQKPPI